MTLLEEFERKLNAETKGTWFYAMQRMEARGFAKACQEVLENYSCLPFALIEDLEAVVERAKQGGVL